MAEDYLIRMENVEKWYGAFHALKNVNLNVRRGEKIVLCGPSGSGKSTLIRCINHLETIKSGTIVVDGTKLDDGQKAIDTVRREVGMVFQQFNLFPHMTVLENCILAPMRVRGISKAEAEATARKYLDRVRIGNQAEKYPAQLSGGQQQRVAAVRAMVAEPARQMRAMAFQRVFELDQELARGLCQGTARGKACHDLALTGNMVLPLADVAPNHLDLGLAAMGHVSLLPRQTDAVGGTIAGKGIWQRYTFRSPGTFAPARGSLRHDKGTVPPFETSEGLARPAASFAGTGPAACGRLARGAAQGGCAALSHTTPARFLAPGLSVS